MTTSLPLWLGFHLVIFLLLAAELVYARHARHQLPAHATPEQHAATTRRTSIVATVGWFVTALLVALFVFLHSGSQPATEFLAGYSIEQALSVDNLFLFLLLFRSFGILPSNQPRILFWGVAGAILMRGAFIAAGIGLLEHVHWISYVFGAVLLIAAVRLVLPKDPEAEQQTPSWLCWLSRLHPISLRQDHFFVHEDNRRMATVLFLALLAIEITDVVFALDSIPAVLSVTRTPFLAYTSNILAVMGLRSLFFLLAHLLERVRYLHLGLAAILAFAALKMLAAPWLTIGPLLSLGIIAGVLVVTFVLSSGTNPPSKSAL